MCRSCCWLFDSARHGPAHPVKTVQQLSFLSFVVLPVNFSRRCHLHRTPRPPALSRVLLPALTKPHTVSQPQKTFFCPSLLANHKIHSPTKHVSATYPLQRIFPRTRPARVGIQGWYRRETGTRAGKNLPQVQICKLI